MERIPGSPETPPGPGKPARKRVRKDAGKPAAKGSAMTDRIALNVTISKRARMTLDAHATLWSGTPKGTASGLIEWLINENLRSVQIRHFDAGEGEAGQSNNHE